MTKSKKILIIDNQTPDSCARTFRKFLWWEEKDTKSLCITIEELPQGKKKDPR